MMSFATCVPSSNTQAQIAVLPPYRILHVLVIFHTYTLSPFNLKSNRLWNTSTYECTTIIRSFKHTVGNVVWSNDGAHLITESGDDVLKWVCLFWSNKLVHTKLSFAAP